MVHVKMGNAFKETSFLFFFFLLIWRELQHEKSLRAFFLKRIPSIYGGFPMANTPLHVNSF